MKKLQFLTLITCAWVLSPLKTQAQNTYALIVGISQYKEMPALQYADRDAIAFADFVKGQGAPDQNISIFLNEDATRMNIVDELYRLSRTLKPQDRFYFYFGGHGDLEAKIGYENAMLLLHGSFKTGYFQGKEFLQLSELKTWLTALSKTQTQVIFIADACHSGGLIGGSEGQTKTQRALQESWANVTKILSSQANEFSLEGQQWGGGRGLFSFHLVNGLTGRADVNKNKLVSVKELDEYLRYHVRREASPNVQTPLVVGEPTLALSKSSASGLAQLAEAEKRNFPVISAVNFKGANPIEKMLAKLDTGIVELYKRFSKAVKERRLADHDNVQDNALLHFRAMAERKIPDTLLNIMKRNLGAALMERELNLLRDNREKGSSRSGFPENLLNPVIRNLDETIVLFGKDHYFYNLLQARKLVLESMRPMPQVGTIGMEISNDALRSRLEQQQQQKKALLLKSLELEPNMVSTYQLLANTYLRSAVADSATYYLEKVIEFLPNHFEACFSVGYIYNTIPYIDSKGRKAPHPQAIKYLERCLQLDSTQLRAQSILASIYKATNYDQQYRNYPRAALMHKKMLALMEKPLAEILSMDLHVALTEEQFMKPSSNRTSLSDQLNQYAYLEYLYYQIGDSTAAQFYGDKLQDYTIKIRNFGTYMNVGQVYYFIFNEFDEAYSYIQKALDNFLLAENQLSKDISTATATELPYLKLYHYEILKVIALSYRNLKQYAQAELYLNRVFAYSISDFTANHRLKMLGTQIIVRDNRILSFPMGLARVGASDYHYRTDPNLEMFFLNLEQNKTAEAMQWLEKALQVSVREKGNDTSGTPFRNSVLETYKNLDVNAFNALYEKYFPKTVEKK